jgi:hypothetical protein
VEEEERQRAEKQKLKDQLNLANANNRGKRKMYQGESSNSKKNKPDQSQKYGGNNSTAQTSAGPPKSPYCPFCDTNGHWQRNCPRFKAWLAKKGTKELNEISNVNESLYTEFSLNTWWVDSGATVHVCNSLQEFRTVRKVARGEQNLRVADGAEIEVRAVGGLTLRLPSGCNLILNNVLVAPSIKRNLISVRVLAETGYDCHFTKRTCYIKFDNKVVGLAFVRDKLYLLSLDDFVMNVINAYNDKAETSQNYGTIVWAIFLGKELNVSLKKKYSFLQIFLTQIIA